MRGGRSVRAAGEAGSSAVPAGASSKHATSAASVACRTMGLESRMMQHESARKASAATACSLGGSSGRIIFERLCSILNSLTTICTHTCPYEGLHRITLCDAYDAGSAGGTGG